jgi:AbrB family looped-hinge helix DNA binding protein
MLESIIGRHGRTTLPKAVRDSLGLRPGDRVRYFGDGNTVRIVPVRPIHRLYGAVKYDGPSVTLDEMDAAIADGACRR